MGGSTVAEPTPASAPDPDQQASNSTRQPPSQRAPRHVSNFDPRSTTFNAQRPAQGSSLTWQQEQDQRVRSQGNNKQRRQDDAAFRAMGANGATAPPFQQFPPSDHAPYNGHGVAGPMNQGRPQSARPADDGLTWQQRQLQRQQGQPGPQPYHRDGDAYSGSQQYQFGALAYQPDGDAQPRPPGPRNRAGAARSLDPTSQPWEPSDQTGGSLRPPPQQRQYQQYQQYQHQPPDQQPRRARYQAPQQPGDAARSWDAAHPAAMPSGDHVSHTTRANPQSQRHMPAAAAGGGRNSRNAPHTPPPGISTTLPADDSSTGAQAGSVAAPSRRQPASGQVQGAGRGRGRRAADGDGNAIAATANGRGSTYPADSVSGADGGRGDGAPRQRQQDGRSRPQQPPRSQQLRGQYGVATRALAAVTGATQGLAPGAAATRNAAGRVPPALTAAAAVTDAAEASDAVLSPDEDGHRSDDAGQDEEVVEEELFVCVVCCEPSIAMAIGKCDHHQVCAKCCLRLRLCYADRKCPLCKSENEDVVIVRPPVDLGSIPSYQSLAAAKERLWAKPKWARGVLVFDPPVMLGGAVAGAAAGAAATVAPRSHPSAPLHLQLLRLTSRSCAVCDRGGRHPFPSLKALEHHLQGSHGRQLCPICVDTGRKFILEHDVLSAEELHAHTEASHPLCQFCDQRFYGLDELYFHMRQMHYACHVCQSQGVQHMYLRDARELAAHLRAEHHACEEPDCVDSFVGFATEEELRQHAIQRHSTNMPRWNPARARPLLLDHMVTTSSTMPRHSAAARGGGRSGGPNAAPGAAGGRHGRRGGAAAGGTDAAADGAAAGQLPPPPPLNPPLPLASLDTGRDTEGGLAIIDDDLGDLSLRHPAAATHSGTGGSTGGATAAQATANRSLAGAWARRAGEAAPSDEYPTLAASAATAPTAGGNAGGAAGGWAQRPVLPTLRRVAVKCPCGRRVQNVALLDEERPPPLACDRECELFERRNQIASAFGVDDPDVHASPFSRPAMYAPHLIQSAQHHLDWLRSVEVDLATFMADRTQKRVTLAAASSERRQLTHALAEHYGLVTVSVGQEPGRAVQLYKAPSSGVPQRTLSAVAASTTPSQLAALLAAVPNWSLRFTDIAPTANINYHLREWTGEYNIAWAGSGERGGNSNAGRGATAATVTFTNERAFKAASDAIAGGMRGEFRVDRAASGGGTPAGRLGGGPAMSVAAGPSATAPPGWQVVTKGKSTRRADEPLTGVPSSTAGAGASVGRGGAGGGGGVGKIARERGGAAAALDGADPWASDGEEDRAAAKGKEVVEDWEVEAASSRGLVPQKKVLQLGDANAWDVLGNGDDEHVDVGVEKAEAEDQVDEIPQDEDHEEVEAEEAEVPVDERAQDVELVHTEEQHQRGQEQLIGRSGPALEEKVQEEEVVVGEDEGDQEKVAEEGKVKEPDHEGEDFDEEAIGAAVGSQQARDENAVAVEVKDEVGSQQAGTAEVVAAQVGDEVGSEAKVSGGDVVEGAGGAASPVKATVVSDLGQSEVLGGDGLATDAAHVVAGTADDS